MSQTHIQQSKCIAGDLADCIVTVALTNGRSVEGYLVNTDIQDEAGLLCVWKNYPGNDDGLNERTIIPMAQVVFVRMSSD